MSTPIRWSKLRLACCKECSPSKESIYLNSLTDVKTNKKIKNSTTAKTAIQNKSIVTRKKHAPLLDKKISIVR